MLNKRANRKNIFRKDPVNKPEVSDDLLTGTSEIDKTPGTEDYLLCIFCSQVITSHSEKIEVQGSHRHTFTNPNGFMFDIGCFRNASGCHFEGPPTHEFSWFQGYGWEFTMCGKCNAHLGWHFIGGSSSFNGLILNRLVARQKEVD